MRHTAQWIRQKRVVEFGEYLCCKVLKKVPHIIENSITSPARRKSWARLIQKIYEVDPLICPKCAGSMKIIAFIEQAEVIKKILQHVGLWETKRNPLSRAGPPPGQIYIDYAESQVVYSGDDCDPDYPFEAYL